MTDSLRRWTKDRRYLDFRIATAATGAVLTVALLITAAMPWATSQASPIVGPYGSGAMASRSLWDLTGWALPDVSFTDLRQWWAMLALAGVVATASLATATACAATKALARSVIVAALLSAALGVVVAVVMHDAYFTPAVGPFVAVLIDVVLAVWAFLVSSASAEWEGWTA